MRAHMEASAVAAWISAFGALLSLRRVVASVVPFRLAMHRSFARCQLFLIAGLHGALGRHRIDIA
jgi:hypothetical protein